MPIIVAISRQVGSGGAYVGQHVARQLGFQYADRDILAAAARALQCEATDVEQLEERAQTFWERVAHLFARGSAEGPFPQLQLPSITETEVFAAESHVIREIAERGDAVIVGRGAAQILRGHPGLVRIFLHAPREIRIPRAMEEYHLANPAEANDLIRRADEQRALFIRDLTGRDWCDSTLYDLSIHTGTTSLDEAVGVILDAVERRRYAGGTEAPRSSP